jgi:hypothetical protein
MYTISHLTQQQRITRKNYVCENNSNPFLRFIICEISTMLGSDRKGSLRKENLQIYHFVDVSGSAMTLKLSPKHNGRMQISCFLKIMHLLISLTHRQMCQQFFSLNGATISALMSRTWKVFSTRTLAPLSYIVCKTEKFPQLENGKLNCCHSTLSLE